VLPEVDGNPTTDRQFIPNLGGRVSISSDKTSGTFRSDFAMHIERIPKSH